MVWIIYFDPIPCILNYFDTKKEAEDYLVELAVKNWNFMISSFLNRVYGFEDYYNGQISYENLELLEEVHPKFAKIDNLLIRLKNIKNFTDFFNVFSEDVVKIVLNDTDYYNKALKFMYTRKEYKLYEKPGKLFF